MADMDVRKLPGAGTGVARRHDRRACFQKPVGLRMAAPINILTTSTLYPNSVQTAHGIFVETRLRRLLADGRVTAKVLAPVPWVPPGLPRADWAKLRGIGDTETRHGIIAQH